MCSPRSLVGEVFPSTVKVAYTTASLTYPY